MDVKLVTLAASSRKTAAWLIACSIGDVSDTKHINK